MVRECCYVRNGSDKPADGTQRHRLQRYDEWKRLSVRELQSFTDSVSYIAPSEEMFVIFLCACALPCPLALHVRKRVNGVVFS